MLSEELLLSEYRLQKQATAYPSKYYRQTKARDNLWTVGLAACSPLCDRTSAQWQAMSPQEQDLARSKATLARFSRGVHSVIDHLEALDTCLVDIAQRRRKGEKP